MRIPTIGTDPICRAVLLAAMAGSLSGCGTDPAEEAKPPNIILITIDTLRPDYLSPYTPTVSTPAFDELARVSAVFERAYCSVPLTLPSHASILTSNHPFRHGIRDNSGYRLDPALPTLAEVLKEQGYATGAFVGAFVLDRSWGLNRGFDLYSDQMTVPGSASGQVAERPASAVLNDATNWIQSQRQAWFAWIHLFDPHTPYAPPESFESAGEDGYAAEIAYVDAQLSLFWEFLREQELFESALIVLTADHGEGLGEHGEKTHGFFIYDSTIRIPLLVKTPESQPVRCQSAVQSIDIAPTILQLAGVRPPPEFQGISLAGDIMGEPRSANPLLYAETYYPYDHFGWSPLHSLRDADFKFIEAPRPELYANQDAAEADNLAPRNGALMASYRERLQSLLEDYERSRTPDNAPHADSETVEKLKSLGYLAFRNPQPENSQDLEDPKEKLDLYVQIVESVELASRGRLEASSQKLRQVLERDPRISSAWNLLAVNLMRQHRPEEAVSPLMEVLATNPEYTPALLNLAEVFSRLKKWKEARDHYQRVLEIQPSAEALLGLARIAVERNDESEARAAVSRLRRLNPVHPDLPELEAGVARLSGDPEAELHWYRQAAVQHPQSARAHANLGQAYLSSGRPAEAEAAFRKGMELDPDSAAARFGLAVLQLEQKNYSAAALLLEEAVGIEPEFTDARYNLGRAYLLLQRGPEAEREFIAALKVDPDHFPSLLALASRNLSSQKLEKAHPLLQRAVRIRPDDPQARYQLGLYHFAKEQFADAALQFEIALRHNPQFVEALTYQGATRLNRGHTEEAIQLLSRAVGMAPAYPSAHFFLGQALIKAGRNDEGMAELRRARELSPER